MRGLFGTFDPEIPLLKPDRVTIIHGPNGFGKTVMLKMIAAFVEGQTGIFEHIPFEEFRVLLEGGSSAVIERGDQKANGAKLS